MEPAALSVPIARPRSTAARGSSAPCPDPDTGWYARESRLASGTTIARPLRMTSPEIEPWAGSSRRAAPPRGRPRHLELSRPTGSSAATVRGRRGRAPSCGGDERESFIGPGAVRIAMAISRKASSIRSSRCDSAYSLAFSIATPPGGQDREGSSSSREPLRPACRSGTRRRTRFRADDRRRGARSSRWCGGNPLTGDGRGCRSHVSDGPLP